MDIKSSGGSAWLAESRRRIASGKRSGSCRYCDAHGRWALGIGYDLESAGAQPMLHACGIDLDAIMADRPITGEAADKLFILCFAPIMAQAEASLNPGTFAALTDARRFVVCDLIDALGIDDWLDCATIRALICEAQAAQDRPAFAYLARMLFANAASLLAAHPWAMHAGLRARRDVAMLRSGNWVPPIAAAVAA